MRTSTKAIPIEKRYFDNESRVQEKQQVKDQQSCIFHTWAFGRFIEIQSNLRRKKLHRTN